MTPPSTALTRDQKVLVIAPDPFLGALIGTVIGNAGLRAVFPQEAERAEAALDRERPLAAVVVEATADAAESELFIRRARKRSVRVLLFGSTADVAVRRDSANGLGVDLFGFPDDFVRFEEALRALATSS